MAVDRIAATSDPASGSVSGVWLEHPTLEERLRAYEYSVDDHFVENMGLVLVAGRAFAAAEQPDGGVLLNETAVRALGFRSPPEAVGAVLTVDGTPDRTVVGVIRDFQFDLLDAPVRPMLLAQGDTFRYANVRVVPGTLDVTTDHVQAVWQRLEPSRPFAARLYSDQLSNSPLNIVFRDLVRIIGLATVLAILIACMGLMAIAAYSAQARTREVGVRKVLGASMAHVVLLLSKDLLRLLALAITLAVPAAWLINRLWLQSFAHHITVGPGLLLTSVGLLLALALTTVASQTVRAALADPVESLRYE